MSSHNTRQKCHYFLGSCFCEEHFRSVYDIKIAIKNSVYCNVQALVLTITDVIYNEKLEVKACILYFLSNLCFFD